METEGPQPTGEGLFAVFARGLGFAARTRFAELGRQLRLLSTSDNCSGLCWTLLSSIALDGAGLEG